jgi:hypothetical protein
MPSITDSNGFELDEITARLKAMMGRLESPGSPLLLTPEQTAELLSDLMRAGECMRGVPPESSEELSRAVCACRIQIERLRDLLPLIHSALLRERARLAEEQDRLSSTSAWAQASSETL